MERGQGDSWRSQRLVALHGCPMPPQRVKGLDDDNDVFRNQSMYFTIICF
jgi:hypothetical protein